MEISTCASFGTTFSFKLGSHCMDSQTDLYERFPEICALSLLDACTPTLTVWGGVAAVAKGMQECGPNTHGFMQEVTSIMKNLP